MHNSDTSQLVRVSGIRRFSDCGGIFIFAVLYLLLGGIALSPLESKVWEPVAASQPTLKLDKLGQAAGQGVILGVLGGMRALTADMIWIKRHQMWREKNYAGTVALIYMTVSLI